MALCPLPRLAHPSLGISPQANSAFAVIPDWRDPAWLRPRGSEMGRRVHFRPSDGLVRPWGSQPLAHGVGHLAVATPQAMVPTVDPDVGDRARYDRGGALQLVGAGE